MTTCLYYEILGNIKRFVSDRYDAYPRMSQIMKYPALEICSRGYNIYLFNRFKEKDETCEFEYILEDCIHKSFREEGKIELNKLKEFLDKKCDKKPTQRQLWSEEL